MRTAAGPSSAVQCLSTDLRQVLIQEWDRGMARWRIPGRICEYEEALKSGKPVVVSSSSMLRAFMAAGLPTDRFAYCGSDWGKSFLLDERDQISEYVEEGRGVGG
jgi:hypothetical protein